jgi:hypothetical protein
MPLPTQLPTPDETMVDQILLEAHTISEDILYRYTNQIVPFIAQDSTEIRDLIVRQSQTICRLQSELAAANARADKSLNPHSLTSQQLKVIDRHCDWQAFKHALGALNNYRSKKEPHEQA